MANTTYKSSASSNGPRYSTHSMLGKWQDTQRSCETLRLCARSTKPRVATELSKSPARKRHDSAHACLVFGFGPTIIRESIDPKDGKTGTHQQIVMAKQVATI